MFLDLFGQFAAVVKTHCSYMLDYNDKGLLVSNFMVEDINNENYSDLEIWSHKAFILHFDDLVAEFQLYLRALNFSDVAQMALRLILEEVRDQTVTYFVIFSSISNIFYRRELWLTKRGRLFAISRH